MTVSFGLDLNDWLLCESAWSLKKATLARMQRDNSYRGLYACFMLKFSAFNLKVLSRCECFIPKWMKYSNDNVVCLVASTLLFDYSKLTTRTKTSTTSLIRITQLQWDTECVYICMYVAGLLARASLERKSERKRSREKMFSFCVNPSSSTIHLPNIISVWCCQSTAHSLVGASIQQAI